MNLALPPSMHLEPIADYKVIIEYNHDFFILVTNAPSITIAHLIRIVKESPDQDCPTDNLINLLKLYNYSATILLDSIDLSTYSI